MLSMNFDIAFPSLVAGRLALAYLNLPDTLQHDHQLSTPLTSYPRLQEGLYLFHNGVDPYSGGLFRHSPLLLSLFSTVLPLNRHTAALLWTASDALAAWALVQIWRARQQLTAKTPRDSLIAAAYLLNPYILLPTLARSTATFENALLLLAVMFACRGKAAATLLTLAVATHLSLTSALYLLPLVLLLLTTPVSHLASPRPYPYALQDIVKRAGPFMVEYTVYMLVLAGAATLASGGWGWVGKTWGAVLTLPDLTPNVGLWWYFFTEMFDHFRPFFLMVFSIHLAIYPLPLSIKFQHDPLYALYALTGVLATFKPYPSLADAGLFVSMAALFPETYAHMRTPFPTALVHLHCSLLLPLFHHLWLGAGTGNANFYYASTLVWGVAMGLGVADAVWAGLVAGIKGAAKKGDAAGACAWDGWEVAQE
ncbi:PIG-U domain-containing protein [Phanerochaete sordida]|uniref:PIG-U domain-containing protein n=1 Tax=Phanerochaete sordida TaxID=48140 RepID=A0A9P3G4Q6_9APHY|nr:PIG-U domain-containing protein [Phanerochaete sordida]